jgi:hypothetical protein
VSGGRAGFRQVLAGFGEQVVIGEAGAHDMHDCCDIGGCRGNVHDQACPGGDDGGRDPGPL